MPATLRTPRQAGNPCFPRSALILNHDLTELCFARQKLVECFELTERSGLERVFVDKKFETNLSGRALALQSHQVHREQRSSGNRSTRRRVPIQLA
ncbi:MULTISPECIES: hypothetical protein [Bradyrhizobium]|uniref:hypothetical protein n=1 Tax=Bradyrhizobium elkanii TaxID=29448 RepID=UPI0018AD3E72|nr:hypothetical protein [Bradyrhizobium elkanii]